jgi:hypothetical protein
MVIHDLDLLRPTIAPDKADTPLVIDPDRMLPGAISFKGLKAIPWRRGQISQDLRGIQLQQLALCRTVNGSRQTPAGNSVKQVFRIAVGEGSDHLGAACPVYL